MSNKELSKILEATSKVTARKFCSHHQGEVPANDGSVVERNRTRRWVCFRCQAKTQKREAEILASKAH